MDFSSGSLAGKLRRCRKFVRQQCRHFKGSGKLCWDSQHRFPEGFPRSGAGSGSGCPLSARGVLWRALRRRLGCCPAGLALIFQGRARVRAQPGECPCDRGTQVTVLKQNLGPGLLWRFPCCRQQLLTPPLTVLGWSQKLPVRSWCHLEHLAPREQLQLSPQNSWRVPGAVRAVGGLGVPGVPVKHSEVHQVQTGNAPGEMLLFPDWKGQVPSHHLAQLTASFSCSSLLLCCSFRSWISSQPE